MDIAKLALDYVSLHVTQERSVIMNAPVTVVVLVVLGCAITWAILKWRYQGIIDNKQSAVEAAEAIAKRASDEERRLRGELAKQIEAKYVPPATETRTKKIATSAQLRGFFEELGNRVKDVNRNLQEVEEILPPLTDVLEFNERPRRLAVQQKHTPGTVDEVHQVFSTATQKFYRTAVGLLEFLTS